ncbi:SPOR domain-containing protein [Parathalassolituus penaei]|uniref:SPOR domain-containing protein n=1 Tax=Parathalassolituus penaei TaxID=2997323 RepID=A0A9X3EHL5_9GAMM|nr:SPOR domain-containing protein [Parathalassolituus penaei]MCY0967365.1 SPOR domain-containing protein [Parathalassolituus penaei]
MVDNTPELGGQVPAMPEEYSSPARYLELVCHLATYSPLLVTVGGADSESLHELAVAVVATYGASNVCHLDGPGLFAADNGSQLLLVRIAHALGLKQLPNDPIAARQSILETAEARLNTRKEPLLVLIEGSEILSPVALNEIAQLALMASHKIAFVLFGTGGFEILIKDSPASAPRYRIQLAPTRPPVKVRPEQAASAIVSVSVMPVAEPVVSSFEEPPVVNARMEPILPVVEPEEREIPMDLGQDIEPLTSMTDVRSDAFSEPQGPVTGDIPPVSLQERRPKKPVRPPLIDMAGIQAKMSGWIDSVKSGVAMRGNKKAVRPDARKVVANEPSSGRKGKTGGNNANKGSGLPVTWMLGASAVLAVILGAMLYTSGDETPVTMTTSLPPVVLGGGNTPSVGEGAKPSFATAGAQQPAGLTQMEPSGSYKLSDTVESQPQSRYVASSATAAGGEMVQSQKVVAAPAAIKPAEIEQPKIVLNPAATTVPKPAAAPAQAPKPVAPAPVTKPAAPAAKPAASANNSGRLAPILNARAGSHVIQMLGSSERKGAEDYVNKWSSQVKPGLYWFETTRDGKPWFVVVSGALPDKKAALAAAAQLPTGIRTASPWVRDVSQIQQQINQVAANKK